MSRNNETKARTEAARAGNDAEAAKLAAEAAEAAARLKEAEDAEAQSNRARAGTVTLTDAQRKHADLSVNDKQASADEHASILGMVGARDLKPQPLTRKAARFAGEHAAGKRIEAAAYNHGLRLTGLVWLNDLMYLVEVSEFNARTGEDETGKGVYENPRTGKSTASTETKSLICFAYRRNDDGQTASTEFRAAHRDEYKAAVLTGQTAQTGDSARAALREKISRAILSGKPLSPSMRSFRKFYEDAGHKFPTAPAKAKA